MSSLSNLVNERVAALRPRLLDTTRRNPLINNVLNARSGSYVSIVDEKPQSILACLGGEGGMRVTPLPPLDDDALPDEKAPEFVTAFENEQKLDEQYLQAMAELDFELDERAFEKQAELDRKLKDKVRQMLGMPPRPEGNQSRDLINHARIHGINPSTTLPDAAFDAGDDRYEDDQLQTLLLPEQLQSRLSKIFGKQRIYAEERGLQVTYIVVGYLRWTMPDALDDTPFKSPLLIIPVELTRDRSIDGEIYSVSQGAEVYLNPVLRQKLEVDARLDLTPILEYLDGDFDAEGLFQLVDDLKPTRAKIWEVKREATLGIYPFQGIDLYHDLRTEGIDFSDFGVIKELMLGKDSGAAPLTDWNGAETDGPEAEKAVPHLVLDADSSQFLSLMKVANGENVALEGPPGSGKSQTIVNAIANALHKGKRVLFVAQKMTALEVVHSRLQALGLEKFVLPMVGTKNDTSAFYDALQERMEMGSQQEPKQIETMRRQLDHQKSTLARYIELITQLIAGTEITVHQFIGLSVKHGTAFKAVPYSMKTLSLDLAKYSPKFSLEDFQMYQIEMVRCADQLISSEIEPESPWSSAKLTEINFDAINLVNSQGNAVCQSFDAALGSHASDVSDSLDEILTVHDVAQVEAAIELGDYWRGTDDNNWLSIMTLGDRVSAQLSELRDLYAAKQELIKTSNLTEAGLKTCVAGADSLQVLVKYLSLNDSLRIDTNLIENLIEKNKSGLEICTQISEQTDRLDRCGLLLPPKRWIEARKALAPIYESEWLVDSLAVSPPAALLGDLEVGQSHLGKLYEVLDASQSVPTLKEARELKSIIEGAGFFGRLGGAYKGKLRLARQWLGYSETEKLDRTKLIQELDVVVNECRIIGDLSFYPKLSAPSKATRTILQDSQVKLRSAVSAARGAGLDESLFGRFLTDTSGEEITEFLLGLSTSHDDWSFLGRKLEKLRANCQFAENNLQALLKGGQLCQSMTLNTVGLIEKANKNGAELSNIECDMSVLSLPFDLDPEITDLKQVEDYIELLESTRGLSPVLLHNCVESNEGAVAVAVQSLLPSCKAVEQLYASLCLGKGTKIERQPLLETLSVLQSHLTDQTGFNNLVQRTNTLKAANDNGFGEVLMQMEAEGLLSEAEALVPGCLVQHFKNLVDKLHGTELMGYSGTTLELARTKLKEIDKKLIELAPAAVASKALKSASPPEGVGHGRKSEYTEMALLRHELAKTRRTPPRKLLKRANGALSELFPCWMMVPGAVAQHLPREETFDLVVIDEASQMTPEVSISALMRASQALISGDTNQLPPSNFFQGLSADEDLDEDVATDEESILELANTQFHPKHRLQWHYRSRHEELIAFSNHYVYDNDLVIFPSPSQHRGSMGVSLVQVNGTFQRGINPAEAQVMLQNIIQFMKNQPDRSLGVVVMNQSQMEQIDGMMIRAAELDSDVADYIDRWTSRDEGLQKFFVKNLENVQGDERDVIFIGTVYGRDSAGKFYQRFGPINGSSGKRRLNVLFSRAKEQIVTFSSIPVDDFRPNEANQGARLLKLWLQFCSTKRLGESIVDSARGGVPDSPFEEHVISAIESLGYKAISQVGVSNYYLDIGVKHPDYPLGYLCGIECDGATYHSSRNARDRDRLRQEVLERLGWDLYRIWSTDWFRDAFGQTEKLKVYLDKLLRDKIASMPPVEDWIEPDIDALPSDNADDLLPDSHSESDMLLDAPSLGGDLPIEALDQTGSGTPVDIVELPQAESPSLPVTIGAKVEVRYLDGARAGVSAKFWLSDIKDNEAFSVPGFQAIALDAPLGVALLSANVGDIVSYDLLDSSVRVEVLGLFDNTHSLS